MRPSPKRILVLVLTTAPDTVALDVGLGRAEVHVCPRLPERPSGLRSRHKRHRAIGVGLGA